MPSRISRYCLIFHKMFFIDKFRIKNNFQCPILNKFIVKVPFCSNISTKAEFYKLVVMFYLLTGQKPKILVTRCSLQGLKKVQVCGIVLHLLTSNFFFKFLIFRSLPLTPQFTPFKIFSGKNFNFLLSQKTQDDDILLQLLHLSSLFSYQILMQTRVTSKDFLKTSLISLKIPCEFA